MLPSRCHEHDIAWIKRQVSMLPKSLKQIALDGYKKVYEEAYMAEPVDHKKENKARFAANTRLRTYVERVNR